MTYMGHQLIHKHHLYFSPNNKSQTTSPQFPQPPVKYPAGLVITFGFVRSNAISQWSFIFFLPRLLPLHEQAFSIFHQPFAYIIQETMAYIQLAHNRHMLYSKILRIAQMVLQGFWPHQLIQRFRLNIISFFSHTSKTYFKNSSSWYFFKIWLYIVRTAGAIKSGFMVASPMILLADGLVG